MKVACVLTTSNYKPGDLPPVGYLEWHEWAEIQRKAGIKQVQCGNCGLWKTQQELSAEVFEFTARDRKGNHKILRLPLCSKCVTHDGYPGAA